MAFDFIEKMPEADELLQTIKLDTELKKIKTERDKMIRAVIKGEDKRFLIIVGPCSAHDEEAVCDYVNRLAILQDKVKNEIIIIPRIYTNKPRTTGEGYKGMLHQPRLDQKPSIIEGLKAIRKMQIRAFQESHLTAADEMLYPDNSPYMEDLLSYIAVGARSVENQQHRLVASGLPVPIGLKNPTSGDMNVMLNSIYAAQQPHEFFYNKWEVTTTGNELAHGILRGSINHYGQSIPNYHYEDLMRISELYHKKQLKNPTLIIDTNHDNSNKKYLEQPRIAYEIMNYRKYKSELKQIIKGFLIESFIKDGSQTVNGAEYGMSITDPCLGWEKTEDLIKTIADLLD